MRCANWRRHRLALLLASVVRGSVLLALGSKVKDDHQCKHGKEISPRDHACQCWNAEHDSQHQCFQGLYLQQFRQIALTFSISTSSILEFVESFQIADAVIDNLDLLLYHRHPLGKVVVLLEVSDSTGKLDPASPSASPTS